MTAPDTPAEAGAAQLAAVALRQVGELLGRLDPEQVAALAAGRGRLVFEPVATQVAAEIAAEIATQVPTQVATGVAPPPAEPTPPAAGPAPRVSAECGDLDATVSAIKALGSRAEVADYLRAHDGRLTVPVLKQVARRLGPTVASSGRSKAELKRNIIEGTAGFRERSLAMSRGAWG